MRIALVSMTLLDQDDFDEVPLAHALEGRGWEPVRVGWDDPRVDWSGFEAALLRSTWDYHHRRDEFLLWARRAAAETRLFNPAELIEWNSHKFYLRELEHAGIAIVPTVFLERGSVADLASILEQKAWDAAVIKPAVSADSFATERAERSSADAGQRHLDQHLAERDMLVQAYMPAVVEPGERCLVVIDGEISHAVRKRSKFLGGRHAGPEGVPVPVEADERQAALSILKLIGHPPLYARIDLIRGADGVPHLMELELVEPSLFFEARPGAAEDLVEALASRLLS